MRRRSHPCDSGRLGPSTVEGEIVTPCPTCYGFREDHPAGCPAARSRAPRPGDADYLGALARAVRAFRDLAPAERDAAFALVPPRYRKIARAALALLG